MTLPPLSGTVDCRPRAGGYATCAGLRELELISPRGGFRFTRGVDGDNCEVLNRKLPRDKILGFLAALPPCDIALEACSSSHYWARERQPRQARWRAPCRERSLDSCVRAPASTFITLQNAKSAAVLRVYVRGASCSKTIQDPDCYRLSRSPVRPHARQRRPGRHITKAIGLLKKFEPLARAKEQLQNDAKRQRTRTHAQTSTSRLDTSASRSYLTDYAFRPSSIAILEHRAWRRVGNDRALFYEKSKKPLLQVVPDAVTIDRGLARLRAHRRVVQRSSGIRFAVALVQPPEPIV